MAKPRSRWWLADQSLTSVAGFVSQIAGDGIHEGADNNVQILKYRPGATVFRLCSCEGREQSYVVKVFRLRRLGHKLKYDGLGYNRFGLSEAANLIIASERGLCVPTVYGYGRIRGSSSLVKMSIVVEEDLPSHVSVGRLLRFSCGDRRKTTAVLDCVIPIFSNLYQASCNHIDVNLGSILVGDEGSQRAYLLDFEHAVFHSTPSLNVVMFEAAVFAQGCSKWVGEELITDWLGRLLSALRVQGQAERMNLSRRFHYYRGVHLSRKERKRIR